ncbi:hypothetical protein FVE85_6996 [Porphyridium purpureum]|uniref:Transmembrane protein n=1 Tax=Porphyridium purpureum TaxID=35688 RepID=A0A5J4Z6C5_PORPP|nr:hypothetical protein FVE85_6996 [Porphyridium purpureum]|eukprot:POR8717..scf295_1
MFVLLCAHAVRTVVGADGPGTYSPAFGSLDRGSGSQGGGAHLIDDILRRRGAVGAPEGSRGGGATEPAGQVDPSTSTRSFGTNEDHRRILTEQIASAQAQNHDNIHASSFGSGMDRAQKSQTSGQGLLDGSDLIGGGADSRRDSAEQALAAEEAAAAARARAAVAAEQEDKLALENLRTAVLQKLKEYNATQAQVANLQANVEKTKADLEVMRQRYKNTFDRRELEAKLKFQAEERVRTLRLQIPELEEHGKKVLSEKQLAGKSVEEKTRTYQNLLQQYQYLVIKLREDSFFETWLDRRFQNLSPVLRGSIRKASRVISPMLEGLEAAAEFNDKVAVEIAESVDRVVPEASRSAFYRGLFFYFGMILPLVSSFSLFHYARQYMSTLQTNQVHTMLSGYLFVVFCLCFLLTAIHQQDVLDRMRVDQETLFLFLVMTHGFAIFLDLVVAIHLAIDPAAVQEKAESVFLVIVLIHAYFHIWRRVVLDLAVTVGMLGYFFYAIIFGSMFLDRTFGAMRRASSFAGIDYERARRQMIDFLRVRLGLRIPTVGSKSV